MEAVAPEPIFVWGTNDQLSRQKAAMLLSRVDCGRKRLILSLSPPSPPPCWMMPWRFQNVRKEIKDSRLKMRRDVSAEDIFKGIKEKHNGQGRYFIAQVLVTEDLSDGRTLLAFAAFNGKTAAIKPIVKTISRNVGVAHGPWREVEALTGARACIEAPGLR